MTYLYCMITADFIQCLQVIQLYISLMLQKARYIYYEWVYSDESYKSHLGHTYEFQLEGCLITLNKVLIILYIWKLNAAIMVFSYIFVFQQKTNKPP